VKPVKRLFDLMYKSELLSLDVFETCLHRSFEYPRDLFLKIRIRLLHSDIGFKCPEFVYDFPLYRARAEEEARRYSLMHLGSSEITLDNIYKMIGVIYGISEDTLEVIKQIELEEELRACFANPVILRLYNEAKGSGKKIIFCSDMYLSSKFIRKMLQKAGFIAEEPILVSGETKLSKWEGTMFADIVQKYEVPRNKILHVGDNYQSDFLMPRKYGLKAWYFDLWRSIMQNSVPKVVVWKDYNSLLINSSWKAHIAKSLLSEKFYSEDKLLRLGYEVFGPLFAGFLLWLIGQFKEDKTEVVLCLARDSYLFYKLLIENVARFELNIPIKYVYVSRTAVFVPTFMDLSHNRLWYLIGGMKTMTVGERLRRLGLSAEKLEGSLTRAGLQLDEVTRGGDQRIYTFLLHNFPTLLWRNRDDVALIRRYLDQVIGDARRIAIVDVGWNGTVQSAISKLLIDKDSILRGYYMALFNPNIDPPVLNHSMTAWLTPGNRGNDWRNVFESGGAVLVELASVAPHGMTLRYKENDGKVKPVLEELKANEEEQSYVALGQKIRKGALHFVKEFLEDLDVDSSEALTLSSSEQWAMPFKRFVLSPTREEAELFLNLTHAGAATDSKPRSSIVVKLPFWERVLPWVVSEKEKSVIWKAGFRVLNRF